LRAVYRKLIFATSFSTGNLLLSHCFDFRISPRSSGIFPNPEEPEGEDEDVQIERRRTTNAGTVEDFDEVERLKTCINILKNTLWFFRPYTHSSSLDFTEYAMSTEIEQGKYTHTHRHRLVNSFFRVVFWVRKATHYKT